MDTVALRAKVQASNLLTQEERAYWLENLEKLPPAQQEKLDNILSRASKLPWNRNIKTYLALIEHGAKKLLLDTPSPVSHG